MERYFYSPRTLFPYKKKILLQRQREQNGKVFLRSQNIISLQGEDSPPAPEGTEWKGIFTLLEHYFLARKRFSSSAKRNRIEMYYYAPRTLFPARKTISPTPKGSGQKGTFMLLQYIFRYKENILLHCKKEQKKKNRKVFLHYQNIISKHRKFSPPAPEGTEWKGIFTLLEHYFLTRRRFSSSASRMERYFYASRTLFTDKVKILLHAAPEEIEWKGIFTLLEHYFLTRKIFSSIAKKNIMEGVFSLCEHYYILQYTIQKYKQNAKL